MAAKVIKVFTDIEALASVEANPDGVLNLTLKLDPKTKQPKKYTGTMFLNAKYKINGQENDGWFTLTQDVPLSRGVADPANKEDKRNEFAGTRNQLEMKLSQAGSIGQFFHKLNPVFIKKIDEMVARKDFVRGTRKMHQLLQYCHGETTEKAGELFEDPVLRFQVETGTFSKEYIYPFLRNQPKTVFLDARTAYKDANGTTQYKLATIQDSNGNDVPVSVENMHKFITNGAVLKAGSRIMVPSGAISGSWISLPIIINKAIIEPRAEVAGFSDEAVDVEALKAALTQVAPPAQPDSNTQQVATTQAQAEVKPAPEPEITKPVPDAQVDELAAVLDGL